MRIALKPCKVTTISWCHFIIFCDSLEICEGGSNTYRCKNKSLIYLSSNK